MGAKFDAVTKGEYADIQGESFVGFVPVPGFQKASKKLRRCATIRFHTFVTE
jgi:hypothetical protein